MTTAAELRFRAAGFLGAHLLRSAGASWRTTVVDDEPLREFRRTGQPVILAHWHSRILPLAYLHRNEGIVVLVSEHGDGEYITRVIHELGFRTARGSSTRGGVRGLRGLLRAHRDGHDLGFTPDGPRGPARVAKPGAVVAAQLTGAPIVPLAAGGSGVWRVGSWDRLVIPKPFCRLRVMYGRPIRVPRDANADEIECATAELGAELDRITDAVDGGVAARAPGPPSATPSSE